MEGQIHLVKREFKSVPSNYLISMLLMLLKLAFLSNTLLVFSRDKGEVELVQTNSGFLLRKTMNDGRTGLVKTVKCDMKLGRNDKLRLRINQVKSLKFTGFNNGSVTLQLIPGTMP